MNVGFWYIETSAVEGFVFASLVGLDNYSLIHNDPIELIRKAKPGEHLWHTVWYIHKDGTIEGE